MVRFTLWHAVDMEAVYKYTLHFLLRYRALTINIDNTDK